MSNTLIKDIQKYCKEQYNLDFKTNKKLNCITYKKGKEKYSFYCQFIQYPEDRLMWWSICAEFETSLYGFDTHYKDNGTETIDYILKNDFHLIKDKFDKQLSLF